MADAIKFVIGQWHSKEITVDWLKHLMTILAYFFDPRVRRRREKERLWKRIRALEDEYAIAMAGGDPEAADRIAALLEDLHEKIIYLEGKGV